jgi:biopolymer transport protein ExbB/TolQ
MNIFNTQIFTWILNSIFFIAILYAFLKAKAGLKTDRNNYVEYAPSLMTSMGLFGTFLGIFIGLLQFDTKHIDGSIEKLLGGLQTAFVTSLIGMAFAIWFKIIQTSYLDKKKTGDGSFSPGDIEPKDIHVILTKQHVELTTIAKGIGGNDERSMVGQIQLLRTDVNDFRSALTKRQESFEEKLWNQMQDFAEMLSKSATQQVIEALKEVIIDFNKNLTEQFGENFKHLDESVKKLVEWQANYMVQLSEMTLLYEQGVQSIDATKIAVQSIKEETGRIPNDMKNLSEVLKVNQHQIAELDRHLDAFVKMRDQAVIAVPQIQTQLTEVGQQLLKGADEVNKVLIKGSEDFENSVTRTNIAMAANADMVATTSENISEELRSAMELLGLNTERIRTGITSAISSAMETVEESSRNILTAAQKSVQTSIEQTNQAREATLRTVEETSRTSAQNTDITLQAVDRQIQDAVNRTNDAVNTQLRQLDEALSRQLNAALQELGAALATIARHLADTYNRNNERI